MQVYRCLKVAVARLCGLARGASECVTHIHWYSLADPELKPVGCVAWRGVQVSA